MSQIEEFFTPTKVAELRTSAGLPQIPYKQGEGWEANREHCYNAGKKRMAEQALEVYDKREAIAQLADMIEELKNVVKKAEEIQEFAQANGLDSMVSFCSWSPVEYELDSIVNCDVESDALRWMASNHDC